MGFACTKHPHHPGLGVCASCVREKLALCIGSVKEEEGACTTDGSVSCPNASHNINKSGGFSYSLEGNRGGASLECDIGQGISSDGNDKESSFYASTANRDGKNRHNREKEGRPDLSWLSAKVFFLRGGLQRVNSTRKQDCNHEPVLHYGSSPASLTWQTSPLPGSSSRSPSKLTSLHSPSCHALKFPYSTQPYTRSPLLLNVGSQRPNALCSPLQLPPLMCSLPASRSSFSLPPSARPAIASRTSSLTHMALSAEEANRRSGQRSISRAGVRTKRKVTWISLVLRKLRTFGFKHHVEHQEVKEEVESAQADSNRTSSATEFDFLRHSNTNNSYNAWNQARHSRTNSYNDLQFPAFNRPQRETRREDSKCNAYNYYNTSPGRLSSFSGLQGRHCYKSINCVQRRDTAELLRFYLPPPSFYPNLTLSLSLSSKRI